MTSQLLDRLNQHFGFKTFRQGQESVISRLVNGESAVAIFPIVKDMCQRFSIPDRNVTITGFYRDNI